MLLLKGLEDAFTSGPEDVNESDYIINDASNASASDVDFVSITPKELLQTIDQVIITMTVII